MAPGFHIRGLDGGEVGCFTSARHHLCPFVGAGCRLWVVGSFVFILRCCLSSLVVLVVVVACDVALPHRCWLFCCWLSAVVVGG